VTLPLFGHYLLLVALATSVLTIGATFSAFGGENEAALKRRGVLLSWAHGGSFASWLLLMAASGVLFTLFLTDNFAVHYVWSNSARAQPLFYKISAFWGGQSGSLLMWAAVLSTYGLLIAVKGKKKFPDIGPTAAAVIAFVNAFFIGLIILQANPFGTIEGAIPKDGFGLNPLLQNYWMQIHPPTLYTGYIGCTVPFALAVAALIHRRFDAEWAVLVRRWTLITWIILFVGIVMGGIWAYETLGWGGYWAWDPVENASLMPWLVLTAFLHSIMLQGRRGILKNWNMVLVSLTFLLSIFGTFLTRSGIVSSVHSFAESDIGGYFLGFLAVIFIATFALIWWRRDDLSTPATVETPFSREGTFLMGNWLLLATTFAILAGTIYPPVYEGFYGTKLTVEQSYFTRTTVPLALLILAIAGIGPLLSWQRTSSLEFMRKVRGPIWFAVLGIPLFVAPLLYFLGRWHTGAGIAFLLVAFLFGSIASEFWRGAKSRQRTTNENLVSAMLALPVQNRRRYGGYIVHIGLAIFFVGIAGSWAFKIELPPRDLKIGETLLIGEYLLRFDGFLRPQKMDEHKSSDVAAKMTVLRDGKPLLNRSGQAVFLTPRVEIFKAAGEDEDKQAMAGQPEQTARRPAIMTNLGHDLYLALLGYDMETGTATIKAYLNPLVMWIWIAVGLFISGTAIALLPERAPVTAPRSARSTLATPGAEHSGNGAHPIGDLLPINLAREIEVEIAVARAKLRSQNASKNGDSRRVRLARDIETEIAAARAKLQSQTNGATNSAYWQCSCGRSMQSEDRFCASCGATRPAEVSAQI